MQEVWRPGPGQVTLLELAHDARRAMTGVVTSVNNGTVTIDMGASPEVPVPGEEVVASFFTPDALYRVHAATRRQDGPTVELAVQGIERVQRRQSPRARASLPVILSDFDSANDPVSVRGETVDIGQGGCRVRTTRPFPPGSDPTVSLRLPDGDSVVTLAAVLQADNSNGNWEYRLVFMGLDDDDSRRLADLTAQLSPA